MADKSYDSPEAFVQRMDSGELDGILQAEIKKLSPEHLEAIALMLMERDRQSDRPKRPT